jgi:hypothetical protein
MNGIQFGAGKGAFSSSDPNRVPNSLIKSAIDQSGKRNQEKRKKTLNPLRRMALPIAIAIDEVRDQNQTMGLAKSGETSNFCSDRRSEVTRDSSVGVDLGTQQHPRSFFASPNRRRLAH